MLSASFGGGGCRGGISLPWALRQVVLRAFFTGVDAGTVKLGAQGMFYVRFWGLVLRAGLPLAAMGWLSRDN